MLIALLVIVYVVGVGVVLSPTVKEKWSSAPASDLGASVVQALPDALAWPARVFHSLTGRD
jgi:Flp pilus assembly pilin Flp